MASERVALYITAAYAQLERGILRERVRAGMDRARKQGKRLGRPRKVNGEWDSIEPGTAGDYHVSPDQLYDAAINIDVGTHYLSDLLRNYHGDLTQALAAYNEGSRALSLHGIYKETQAYIDIVLEHRGTFRDILNLHLW